MTDSPTARYNLRWFNVNCCQPGQTYDASDLNQPGDGAETRLPLEPADRAPVGHFSHGR
jgi:hypothetical protein